MTDSIRASCLQPAASWEQPTGEEVREVLRLAVDGMANKVIARRLGISHRTVEIHKARIMHKTGAANLLDLAHLAEACPRFLAD